MNFLDLALIFDLYPFGPGLICSISLDNCSTARWTPYKLIVYPLGN
jgi:hypothetical protein